MVAPSKPLVGDKGGDKAVMGALRQKQSGKAAQNVKLDMIQILKATHDRENPKGDFNKFLNGLGYMAKTKGTRFIQIGNTVFMIIPKSGGVVELHTSSVEPPDTIVKRWQTVPKTLKEMGFTHLISYSTSPAINKLVKKTGLPVKISQSQQMINGQMVPAYKYDLDL